MSSAAASYQAIVGFILIVFVNWLVRRIDRDSALF
jgi:putative aldouronate transport system permease protein